MQNYDVHAPCLHDAAADLHQRLVCGCGWTPWQPLEQCWQGQRIPTTSGLYRVRFLLMSAGEPVYCEVIYMGQSRNLHDRLEMMADVFRHKGMPFKTPHVAGPFLWALRHRARLERIALMFEVSIVPLDEKRVPKALRLGYEVLSIALHRQIYGRSPASNYSKIIDGYVSSTYNTGPEKSYRGVPSPQREKSHLPSLVPAGPLLEEAPTSRQWCGHQWSDWIAAPSVALSKGLVGLYRIRFGEQDDTLLLFIGSGKLRDRLNHYRQQAAIVCSWAIKPPCEQGYQEYVDDAIASHVLATSHPPVWQFKQDEEKRQK